MQIKPVRLTERLTGVAVTPEMRNAMSHYARQNGVSIGQVVRVALDFFFANNFSDTRVQTETKSTQQEGRQS